MRWNLPQKQPNGNNRAFRGVRSRRSHSLSIIFIQKSGSVSGHTWGIEASKMAGWCGAKLPPKGSVDNIQNIASETTNILIPSADVLIVGLVALHSAISRSPNLHKGQMSLRLLTSGGATSSANGKCGKVESTACSVSSFVGDIQNVPPSDTDGDPSRRFNLPIAGNGWLSCALHELPVFVSTAKRFCWSTIELASRVGSESNMLISVAEFIKLSSFDIPSKNGFEFGASLKMGSRFSTLERDVDLTIKVRNKQMENDLWIINILRLKIVTRWSERNFKRYLVLFLHADGRI